LPDSRYSKGPQRTQFFEQLLERVRNTPGVEAAGAISQLPLSGYSMIGRFPVEGEPPGTPEEKHLPTPIGIVASGYFATMKIPLRQGRLFNEGDGNDRPEVALVNEAFARKYWPNENPIGKKIGAGCDKTLCRTVVGVVGDIHHEGLAQMPQPEIYTPHLQFRINNMSLVVRTKGEPMRFVSAVRDAVRTLDKDQPIALVQTLEEHVAASILQPRLITTLLGIFAALALLLAAVGVYAMMSYTIAQRTGEIGIRMALGAARSSIFRLVLRQAMRLVAAGVAIGWLLLLRVRGCSTASSLASAPPIRLPFVRPWLFSRHSGCSPPGSPHAAPLASIRSSRFAMSDRVIAACGASFQLARFSSRRPDQSRKLEAHATLL
jgi:predicted permease